MNELGKILSLLQHSKTPIIGFISSKGSYISIFSMKIFECEKHYTEITPKSPFLRQQNISEYVNQENKN